MTEILDQISSKPDPTRGPPLALKNALEPTGSHQQEKVSPKTTREKPGGPAHSLATYTVLLVTQSRESL